MPHFIIECSENVLQQIAGKNLMQLVYEEALGSGLFAPNDIKVRIAPYNQYLLAEGKKSFLHVFAYIMEGRTAEQKAALSRQIIARLDRLLPELSILSMNVADFEKSSYCNKALIQPDNVEGNRHFGL